MGWINVSAQTVNWADLRHIHKIVPQLGSVRIRVGAPKTTAEYCVQLGLLCFLIFLDMSRS